MNFTSLTNRGFGLLESLIVVGIIGLLASAVVTRNSQISNQINLTGSTSRVIDSVQQTRQQALATESYEGSDAAFGLYFDTNNPNQYIVYADCTLDDNGDGSIDENDEFRHNPGSTDCSGDGVVETNGLRQNTSIEKIETSTITSDGQDTTTQSHVSILFVPPEPSVWITDDSGNILSTGSVTVTLGSTRSAQIQKITFYGNGSVEVGDVITPGAAPSVDLNAESDDDGDDTITVSNGTTITLNWTSTNIDDGCEWTNGPLSGSAPDSGSVDDTPPDSTTTTYELTCSQTDGDTAKDSVEVTTTATNDAPNADNDTYSTGINSTLTVSSPGVLENDSDPNGDSLSSSQVSSASNGTVTTFNTDGSFTYDPNTNYVGSDSFTYEVSDGNGGTDQATVGITVTNDCPNASADAYSTPENNALNVSAPGVLDNDNDPNGDSLSASLTSGPSNGSVTLDSDGSFEYTPNSGYSGNDSFSYRASDGRCSDEATVDITVSAPPNADNDSYSTDEDTTLTVSPDGVLSNDSDPEGDPITADAIVFGPSDGSATLDSDGSFEYTPNPNYNGSDTFDYEISDSAGGTDSAAVSITINSVNDAPNASDDSYSTNKDTTLSVSSPGVLDNDSDPEGDSLSVSAITNSPDNGSLDSWNSNGAFEYTPNSGYTGGDSFTYEVSDGNGGTDTATVTITVNETNDAPTTSDDSYSTNENTTLDVNDPDDVLENDSDPDGDSLSISIASPPSNGSVTITDASAGEFEYTPDTDYTGTDSFTYEASDGNGGTDTATVDISVDAVTPTASNDSYSTDEDTTLDVNDPDDVLENDSDPNGDSLTFSVITAPSNGTITVTDASAGEFEYSPNTNWNGTDSFEYEASDGNGNSDTATVDITVNAVNDCPTASASHTEDDGSGGDTKSIDFSGSGTDIEGDSLTYTWDFGDGNTASGQSITHTYNTPQRFVAELTVSDGSCTATDTTVVFAGCGLDLDKSSVTESSGNIYFDMWNTCKNTDIKFQESDLTIYAEDNGADANAVGWTEDDYYTTTEYRYGDSGYVQIADDESTCDPHSHCLGNDLVVANISDTQNGTVGPNSKEGFEAGPWFPDSATDSGDYLTFPNSDDKVLVDYRNVTNLNSSVEIILAPSGNSSQNTFGE